MPLHLLFPLFSSVVFVLGMLLGKQAILRGASPWTSTFLANLWLAACWAVVGAVQADNLPLAGWWQAALVGLCFMAGQTFTYLAFQYGDVSVATPIFGIKVIIVAILLALLAEEPIGGRVWAGAVLAALGVGCIQAGVRSPDVNLTPMRAALTILLALTSATALSLFDIGLQTWGRTWGSARFLPATFLFAGLFSCAFIPWVDSPARLITFGALRSMLLGTLLIAVQAMSMAYSLSRYGDATRINIVYALRGLWAVGLAWLLARALGGPEARHTRGVMLLRLAGALLLMLSVLIALGQG